MTDSACTVLSVLSVSYRYSVYCLSRIDTLTDSPYIVCLVLIFLLILRILIVILVRRGGHDHGVFLCGPGGTCTHVGCPFDLIQTTCGRTWQRKQTRDVNRAWQKQQNKENIHQKLRIQNIRVATSGYRKIRKKMRQSQRPKERKAKTNMKKRKNSYAGNRTHDPWDLSLTRCHYTAKELHGRPARPVTKDTPRTRLRWNEDMRVRGSQVPTC